MPERNWFFAAASQGTKSCAGRHSVSARCLPSPFAHHLTHRSQGKYYVGLHSPLRPAWELLLHGVGRFQAHTQWHLQVQENLLVRYRGFTPVLYRCLPYAAWYLQLQCPLACSLCSCLVHNLVHQIAPCLLILLVGNDGTDLNQETLQTCVIQGHSEVLVMNSCSTRAHPYSTRYLPPNTPIPRSPHFFLLARVAPTSIRKPDGKMDTSPVFSC